MKERFEKWFLETFGKDKKHLLRPYDHKDGYQYDHANVMWIGFCGGWNESCKTKM